MYSLGLPARDKGRHARVCLEFIEHLVRSRPVRLKVGKVGADGDGEGGPGYV